MNALFTNSKNVSILLTQTDFLTDHLPVLWLLLPQGATW